MTSNSDSSPRGTQVLERAVMLLKKVAALPHGRATLSELVSLSDLNRTTAFRLLRFLTDERLLEFDEDRRCYSIGPLAVELGLAGGGMDCLSAPWSDAMRRISEGTGLTTYLVAQSGTESVCLEAREAQTALRAVPLLPGQRLPLGIGAGSLAILASMPDADIEQILEANADHVPTGATQPVERSQMWDRILATRERGYAYSQQTVAEGIVGLGLLLPTQDGLTLRAASVSKVGQDLPAEEQQRLVGVMRKELSIVKAERNAA